MKSVSNIRIFVVEDDPVFSRMLEYILSLVPEHEVHLFKTGAELINNLHKKPSVVTLDYTLPDSTGEEILKRVKYFNPDIPVIIISGQEEVKTAVRLLKQGAYDYITKDEDIRERLLNSINNLKKNISLTHELEELKSEISKKYEFEKVIIGKSNAMKKVFAMMEKASQTNITVSVTGQTGTGKELVAKAIHFNSARKSQPFVAVNIAAIPESLLESELFGHEKGAFTGAMARRIGKFEEAHKGSIFLDEIGEMTLNLQAKLLRVLQEKEITRIGGNSVVKLDVRIVTATHRDLAEEVKKGNFREDLYYRLLGFPIYLPPLKDRESDVLLISKFFMESFAKENNIAPPTLSADAQKKLLSYTFPGNIRELKAVIDLASVMCNGGKILAEDIQFHHSYQQEDIISQEDTLQNYIYKILRKFLARYNNNVVLVAEKLDIGKSTIYRYLKEMEALNL